MLSGRALAGVVLVALGLPLVVGCGGGATSSADEPSRAATDCRTQWKRLGDDVAPQAALTQPSALPDRWNTVVATIDYYSTSATGKSCGAQLDEQRRAIATLQAWSSKLVGFDMQAQLAQVQGGATAYAAGPWPPPKQKHAARPPRPALVAATLKALVVQAPVATQQQRPGWEQASVVDLGDTAATAKAIKDLQFLSTESTGWSACQAALATIRAALAAKTG